MAFKDDLVPILKETWSEFQRDEAGQLGAALSYYAMFSIFPLLLLLIAGFGYVLQYSGVAIDARQQVLRAVAINLSPSLSATLDQALSVVQEGAGQATLVGLLTLLLGASGVFQQLDLTFNKIWNVPPQTTTSGFGAAFKKLLRDRLVSFGMVLAVGFLLLVSLATTFVTSTLSGLFENLPVVGGASGMVLGLIATLFLNTLIVAILFKYLPRTLVLWSDVLVGAFVTALIWEIAKRLLTLYIGTSSYASAYGLVGTVLVLMAWIYFSSQVLFLGAEFTEVYARWRGSHAPHPAEAPPTPLVTPELPPEPTMPWLHSNTLRLAAATGAGLAIGALGGLIAGLVALLIGIRRALLAAMRHFKHR